jgi:hypothetical protein
MDPVTAIRTGSHASGPEPIVIRREATGRYRPVAAASSPRTHDPADLRNEKATSYQRVRGGGCPPLPLSVEAMSPHDDELPEDHATLLQLAADVHMGAAPLVAPAGLPWQRGIDISDAASALVGEPLVGLDTHGR